MKDLNFKQWVLIITAIAMVFLFLSRWGWRFTGTVKLTELESKEMLVENLKKHVYQLSSEIGNRSMDEYEHLIMAEKYIASEFAKIGYDVHYHEYILGERTVRNIIVEVKGRKTDLETLIVGAHYDTYWNPGADDNASGIAGLIELSRLCYENVIDSNIRFIAFVNEEPPYYRTNKMGSMAYLNELHEKGEKIKGGIILEMIGYYSEELNSQDYPFLLGPIYPNRGNYILAIANNKSKELLNQFVEPFRKACWNALETITMDVTGVDFSDNWSFWEKEYQALMITDTGFYRNHNYHSEKDTYDTLNYEYMSEVIRGIYGSLSSLVNE